MQPKISLKWSLFILCAAGIIFFTIIILFPIHSIRVLATGQPVSAGIPLRLKIPSIRVDAAIEQVSLTAGGAMDVPTGPDNTAWYKLGPRPGEKGSAVIDGHSGWKNGIPAVFDNLNKLRKGDKIYVEDQAGVTFTFVVREIRTYDPNADAGQVFYSKDNQAHLNLITCEGAWNEITKSRSERLVIFTDLLSV
jgi:sortase A